MIISKRTTPKPCKGTGKAKGFGCGDLITEHTYGLCRKGNKCFNFFLLSDNGKEVIQKTKIKASKQVKKEKREEIKKQKESIKTLSDYKGELQNTINAIVRLLDNEKGCISCDHGWGKPWSRQRHAGHRLSVGSTPELRFNVLNIWGQCSICNNWKSGNERNYDKGIIKHYGEDLLESIKELRVKYPSLHITIPELKEAIIQAKTIKKDILNGATLTRNEINKKIGIYK